LEAVGHGGIEKAAAEVENMSEVAVMKDMKNIVKEEKRSYETIKKNREGVFCNAPYGCSALY
jgi:hypothetical protein